MAITADYHLHSSFSGDSRADMEEMIQKAISLGLKNICFTEHMDLNFPVDDQNPAGKWEVNVDSYLFDLLKLRNKYIKEIYVAFGLELGLQPDIVRQNVRVAKDHDYDFIIASQHLVNGKDPYYPSYFEGRSKENAIKEYFEGIYENIRAYSNFDVFGHLDYVVRYAPGKDDGYAYETYREILDSILKRLIDREKGIELNTSAIFEGMKEMHPSVEILKRYKELGGEIITIGSDAHKPEHVAYDFPKIPSILKEAGFEYFTVFKQRKPVFYQIP